ncbi:MAG: potassium/proton antiporter [Candidatus Gastranaerophilales bacterium]|nr:potassium/proton antiporter [Candidatus Gastranaerophilales bacterium]
MDKIILIASIMFLSASLSSKIAGKLGLPVLLIFILIGIIFSSDVLGIIYFDNYYAAQFIGVIALDYILFAGALSIDIKEIKPVYKQGICLATIGVFLTAIFLGFVSHKYLKFSLSECMLLGAIVSSTDAAAVFSILRSKEISLKNNLKPLLELESGANDPMAVFLTVAAISFLNGENSSFHNFIFLFIKQMLIGVLSGYLIGKLAVKVINKIHLAYNGLYVVLTIAIVAFAYSMPAIIGGNGFMSVYTAGITMSSLKFVHKRMLIKFHDGIAWLMQTVMFLILGLLIFVKDLIPALIPALIITAILIFIARPLAVFISLIPFKNSVREKLFISWVGLRGAAPIVLATFPLLAGIEHSHEIFSIIFFVVILSVVIQGTTIPYAAKFLKQAAPPVRDSISPFEFEAGETANKLFELQVQECSKTVNKKLKEIKLPKDSLITMISRGGDFLIPSGDTILEECDIVFVLSDSVNENSLKNIFEP